jgi:hypothetical protein
VVSVSSQIRMSIGSTFTPEQPLTSTLLEQRRNGAAMAQAQETMHRIGLSLIEEKRDAVVAELEGLKDCSKNAIEGDKTTLGRDILSVLSAFSVFSQSFARLQRRMAPQFARISPPTHRSACPSKRYCRRYPHSLPQDTKRLDPPSHGVYMRFRNHPPSSANFEKHC